MKIVSNFFELAGELDQKYFPAVLTHRDRHHSDKNAQKMHYTVELFNNGCLTYDKLIARLSKTTKESNAVIHQIVSKYIKDFEGYKFKPKQNARAKQK